VKAAGIDFTTMYTVNGNLVDQLLTTSLATNTTITIPASVPTGSKVELNVSIEYNNDGGGLKDMQCRVLKNGTSQGDRYVGAVTGIYFVAGNWLDHITVNPGDTLTIQFAKSNGNAGGAVVSRAKYTLKQVK
jgi:hypothetical protein